MRILIAEKDPVGRRLLEQTMRMEGYEVFLLDRNNQTRSLINEIKPDIVLINMFTPLQSGSEPLEKIKVRCNGGPDPVIFVTPLRQHNGLGLMAGKTAPSSLFDRLPSKIKMHIASNIQRLSIALKLILRWSEKGGVLRLEKIFSMDELETYSMQAM